MGWRVYAAAMRNPKTKDAVVIRMYSVKTEEEVVSVTARPHAGDDEVINEPSSVVDYLELWHRSLGVHCVR